MRRRVIGLLIATVVAATTLGPATAHAGPPPVSELPVHPEWGSISVPSGTLQKGCAFYGYSYSFDPPEGDWAVEIFLTGPRGEALWSGGYLDGSDPLTGSGYFKFCSTSTVPGTFTMRGKLSVENGPSEYTEGQVPPATFVLGAPSKNKKKRDSVIVPFSR